MEKIARELGRLADADDTRRGTGAASRPGLRGTVRLTWSGRTDRPV